MGHEHEMRGVVVNAPGAVLVKDPVEAFHQAADVAHVHGEVERLLDRDADLARHRRRRERTGQLHSAQRGLARPEHGGARLGGSGPAQGVPVPIAVGIPEHAAVGDLHDQAGGPAVVEDAGLDGIGDLLRREHGRRARREPEGRGDGEGAAWAAPVRAHREASLEGISSGEADRCRDDIGVGPCAAGVRKNQNMRIPDAFQPDGRLAGSGSLSLQYACQPVRGVVTSQERRPWPRSAPGLDGDRRSRVTSGLAPGTAGADQKTGRVSILDSDAHLLPVMCTEPVTAGGRPGV